MFWEAIVAQSEEALPLQESMINLWAEETFPSQPTRSIVSKLKEEMKELSLTFENGGDISSEIGDMFIVLSQLAARYDTSVYRETAKKMLVNHQRTWNKQQDGTYKHVS